MSQKLETKSKNPFVSFLRNPFGLKRTSHLHDEHPKGEITEADSANEKRTESYAKFPMSESEGVKDDDDEDDSEEGFGEQSELRQEKEVDIEIEQKRYFRHLRSFLNRTNRSKTVVKKKIAGKQIDENTAAPQSEHSISTAEHIFQHPEAHPALLHSKASAMCGRSYFLVLFFSFVIYFLDLLKRITLYLCGVPSDVPYFVTPSTLKAVIHTLSFSVFVWLTSHRIFASVVGGLIRMLLRGTYTSDGSFDIYCDWISYRGIWDKNELVFSNLVWRNPPEFKKTPFLLACRELKVSFNLFALFQTILYVKSIKFDEIVIDGLEIYFERNHTETVEDSLNAWHAVGAKDKDAEKTIFKSILMGIWGAIKNRIHKQSLLTKLKNSVLNKMNVAPDEDEEDEFISSRHNSDSVRSNQSLSSVVSTTSTRKNQKPLPTVEFNRLNVYDLVAHPLDLLTRTQSRYDLAKQNMIMIPHFYMSHKDCTGKPKRKGDPRVALPADDFGDKFGDAFGGSLVSNNSFAIASILAHSYINRTKDAVNTHKKDIHKRLSKSSESMSSSVSPLLTSQKDPSIASVTKALNENE